MRFVGRSAVALAFMFTVLRATPAAPATGARSAPIGSIVQATRDKGAVDTSSEGTTIYDGDSLTTGGTNTLMARLGGPRILLNSNSGVVVHGIANGFAATLTSGTIAASAGSGQTFQVTADGLTIQPFGAEPAVAQMTLLNATQIEVTSAKGVLKVSMGGQTDTIEEGKSYRLEVEPDTLTDAGPQGGPPTAAGRSHFKKVVIIILVGATAIVVWRALMSPSKP